MLGFIKGRILYNRANNIHTAVSKFSLKRAEVPKVFDFIDEIGFRRQGGRE